MVFQFLNVFGSFNYLIYFLIISFFTSYVISKKKTRVVELVFLFCYLILSIFLSNFLGSRIHLIIFLSGMLIGYLVDFLRVYVKDFKYDLFTDYSYLSGMVLGFVALVVYNSQMIPLSFYVLSNTFTLFLIAENFNLKNNINSKQLFKHLINFSLIFVNLPVFLISIFIGAFLEFLNAEAFKNWKREDVNYLSIVSSFAALMVLIISFANYLVNPIVLNNNSIFLLSIFVIFHGINYIILIVGKE